MNLIYNSDSFSVVQIDAPALADGAAEGGGFEIVDKWARQGTFLRGALAQRFRHEAEALNQREADADTLDAFIAGYTGLAPQPLVLH